MIGIYKITSPTNRVYIGQSIDIYKRFNQYKNLQNVVSQKKLHKSFLKYGVENHIFEIILICDIDNLNHFERQNQEIYDCIKTGLNCYLTDTKEKRRVFCETTRLKMSESAKGKTLSETTRKKISEKAKKVFRPKGEMSKMYGKKHSEYTKKLLSERQIGVLNHNFGKKASIDTRLKISLKTRGVNNPMFGTRQSKETKAKVQMTRRPPKHNNTGKIVLDTLTGVFYDSAKEASLINKIHPATMNCYLKNKFKTASKYIYV